MEASTSCFCSKMVHQWHKHMCPSWTRCTRRCLSVAATGCKAALHSVVASDILVLVLPALVLTWYLEILCRFPPARENRSICDANFRGNSSKRVLWPNYIFYIFFMISSFLELNRETQQKS